MLLASLAVASLLWMRCLQKAFSAESLIMKEITGSVQTEFGVTSFIDVLSKIVFLFFITENIYRTWEPVHGNY